MAGRRADPADRRDVDERALLAINYTSGTTGRPKGVMYHHRGAYLQALAMAYHARLGPDGALPVDAADVPLQRLVLHLGGDRGRRHPRLPAHRRRRRDLAAAARPRASPTSARAPTVLTMIAEDAGGRRRSTGAVHVATGGAPPSPALLRRLDAAGLRRHPPLRAHRDVRPDR